MCAANGSGGGEVKLWRKVYFSFLVVGCVFGLTISIIFRDIDLLPGLSLISSGILLGVPFGIVLDREILKEVEE